MLGSSRTVTDLVAARARGDRIKFLFFWGHQPERDGSIGAGCLSQWWPAPFTADGIVFATAEHYMMWRKGTLFGDDAMAERVLAAPHPHAAKAFGGRVAGFDQQTWDEHRFAIVVAGNLAKFGQHADLRAFLLGTERRVLVEASPVDRIWGIGLTRDDPAASDPARWRGLNLLGFALMQVRDVLHEEPER
ncbi:NADAR family protein [Actinoplanes aureus]|uniref:NADAR family protein n=1 Tax=Actinoplanes aureus TaxID=2792083 RepID=A0A931CHG5_9ACTN|nr:NADAR family protein [Actinoplanes aureus]MBG0568699.1 NADAR family protein [Actinoplanes aureus]